MKRIICGILLCLCIIGMNCKIYAADVVNPCTLTATPLDENGCFTVNLNIAKSCVMKAYKFEVSYNKNLAQLVSGTNSYGYYVVFKSAYTFNGNGLIDSNHVAADSKIIFAGAQPELTLATMGTNSRCGYMTFQLKTDKTTANYNAALNSISMVVKNLINESGDVVKGNASVFQVPVVTVGGDSLRGEKVLLGDVNFDGTVDLSDAKSVLQAALGIINFNNSQMQSAEVDFDGTITLKDAQLVLQSALGIITL